MRLVCAQVDALRLDEAAVALAAVHQALSACRASGYGAWLPLRLPLRIHSLS